MTEMTEGLERFAQAKADIRAAFTNIRTLFVRMQDSFREWIVPENESQAQQLEEQIITALRKAQDIDQAVARDSMKVVFVGLTSAGKSTTINTVLRTRVLPSGFGQTTNRFISLYPTNEERARLVDPVNGKDYQLQELHELANALSDMHEQEDAEEEEADISDPLNLYWPANTCEILKNDLVILDSPGLRFNKKFDDWIDHTASDADVFILVVNGEMALGREATEFFEQVRRKFTKPNVFVLFNRWELAPQACDRVRKQLLGLAKRLLVDTLNLMPASELPSRVFFVSSKETLERRCGEPVPEIKESDTQALTGNHLTWQNTPAARDSSFAEFEREFALATSQHAISTRFQSKVQEGDELVHVGEEVMQHVKAALDQHLAARRHQLEEHQQKLTFIQTRLPAAIDDALELARTVPDEIQQFMSEKMEEILRLRLTGIIADFTSLSDFEEEESIELEKRELSSHIEACLQVELNDACAPRVRQLYLHAFERLTTLFKDLLPDDSPPQQHMQMAFRNNMTLDCSHLPQHFNLDLSFHFSWGWQSFGSVVPDPVRHSLESLASTVLHRFSRSYKSAFGPGQEIASNQQQSTTSQVQQTQPNGKATQLVHRVGSFIFDVGYICWDITTNTPYGLMMAATLPYAYRVIRRPWIRNIIVSGVFLYTATYAYEYMSFTTAAKERRFRKQFAEHALDKLQITASSRARDAKESIMLDISESLQHLQTAVMHHKEHLQTTICDLKSQVDNKEHTLATTQTLAKQVEQQKLTLAELHAKYFSKD
eukprot:m.205950 g.205950  ORF g.205950 m.205950 type:complete len:774 (-) comp16900_c2_seq5:470-2791(-)